MLSKRENIIFHIAIAAVFCGLALNFFIVPVLSKYGRLKREIALSQANLIKYARLTGQKSDIKDKYNAFSSGLKDSGEKDDAAVGILAQLEQMAAAANIRITDVRPQTGNPSSAHESALIELKAEASLEDYIKFIYDIESPLSLLRIKNLQLTAKPGTRLLDASLAIYGFSLEKGR